MLDVGGYQIIDLDGLTFTGVTTSEDLTSHMTISGSTKDKKAVAKRMTEALRNEVPVMFRGVNADVTGTVTDSFKNASLYGYHFITSTGAGEYAILTHLGVLLLKASDSTINVFLERW